MAPHNWLENKSKHFVGILDQALARCYSRSGQRPVQEFHEVIRRINIHCQRPYRNLSAGAPWMLAAVSLFFMFFFY